MGNDEIALPPCGGQTGARWPDILLRLTLESVVNGLGVGYGSVGVDDLSDDRITVGTVGVGVGTWLRVVGTVDVDITSELGVDTEGLRRIRVVLKHQHDVGAKDVLIGDNGFGSVLVQNAYSLTLFTDLLGQHEGLATTCKPINQLSETSIGRRQHANLGMDLRKPNGRFDVLGVGGDKLGVIPRQGDRGERCLQRGRSRHHLDTQTGLSDPANHTEKQRVTGGDNNDVGVIRQRLDPLNSGPDKTKFLTLIVGDSKGIKVTLTTDDEISLGNFLAQGVANSAEISVDANHELPFVSGFVEFRW